MAGEHIDIRYPNATEEDMPKQLFHVVLSTDSLSFPRPWNQKHLDDNPEQFFTFQRTYPYLLRNRLQDSWPSFDIQVSNLGRRAVTVSNLKNVGRDILSWMSPDVAVIHHGIVDCWIRNNETLERRTSEEEYGATLREFMDLRRETAAEFPVILIKILHTNERMLASYPSQNELIDRYNAILDRLIAEEPNVYAVELPDSVEAVHEDGHHLSRMGHDLIADRLADTIMSIASRNGVPGQAIAV